jgi:hypothetical protein
MVGATFRARLDRRTLSSTLLLLRREQPVRGGDDTTETVDETVDEIGNRTLIDAARAAGVGQFIFVSAPSAAQGIGR